MRSQPSLLGLTFLIAIFAGMLACSDAERSSLVTAGVLNSSAPLPSSTDQGDDGWSLFPPKTESADEASLGKPLGDTQPSWSPSGEWIVFVANRDGQQDLFLARPDGRDEIRLTDDAEVDRYPVWSPDGTKIAFARQAETGWGVFTLSPLEQTADASAEPERLTDLGDYVAHLDWSPSGTKIAFDRIHDGEKEIVLLDLESGVMRRLSQSDRT